MLIALIVATEIAFWVLLAAGLATRYLLRWKRTSTVLLASVPLVDLVLLVATTIDLAGGATARGAHGIADAYIGFSVAFGPRPIRWADQSFHHRFAGGPEPRASPRGGREATRYGGRSI